VSYASTYTIKPADAGKSLVAVLQIYDDAGNLETFGPPVVSLKSNDILAPSLTGLSPSDGSGDVPIGADLTLTFDEVVSAGAGSFSLKKGATTITTIFASDTSQVSFNGRTVTINPNIDLAYSADYVLVASADSVRDLAGNAWAGTGNELYDFKTFAAPLNGAVVAMADDNLIDAMTNGYKWALSESKTVDWSMSKGAAGEYWNTPLDMAFRFGVALDIYSLYADVNFNFVGYFEDPAKAVEGGSEINFSLVGDRGVFNNDAVWAFGFFPKPDSPFRGDIYFNLNSQANTLKSYDPGSAGFFVVVHELGHTLGLKHPHDDGGTGRPTFTQLGWDPVDTDFMTVMSYNDDYNFNRTVWDPATPMILDVLALQYLYGKNTKTNAGDSIHTLTDSHMYLTIWDASGADVIDQSAATEGWYIALPDIQLSSKVDTKAGIGMSMNQMFFSTPTSLTWLAGDIEHAKGSQYADSLLGNAFANALIGNAGNDELDGGGGADTLVGGLGSDVYTVDLYKKTATTLALQDTVTELSGAGVDTLRLRLSLNEGLSTQAFTLPSNIENMDASLTGLNKLNLTGSAGGNVLTGNAAANLINGGAGADIMLGGGGNDTYLVDNTKDQVIESTTVSNSTDAGGIDTVQSTVSFALGSFVEHLKLTGNTAVEALGNELANVLTGNSANNVLYGAGGQDSLIGGTGDDIYFVDLYKKTATTLALQDVLTELIAEGTDSVFLRLSSEFGLTAQTISLGANLENLDASLTGGNKLSLLGNALNNSLIGNTAGNSMSGLAGDDVIFGGAGDDTLLGGLGADTLSGDAGADRLYGGADGVRDFFDFNNTHESRSGSMDFVFDFVSGIDKLDFAGIDANVNLTGDQAFINDPSKALRTGELAYFLWFVKYDTTGTANDYVTISGDVDGVSGADFAVKIMGVNTLKMSDVLL
jgi:serralysin